MTPDLLRRISVALTLLAACVFAASLIGPTAQRVVIALAVIMLFQALPVMLLHRSQLRQRVERAESLIEQRGGQITALVTGSGDTAEIIGVSLAGCRLAKDDLIQLAGLPALETLDLSRADGVDDASLSELERFRRLSSLDVSFTSVTDSTLELLSRLPQLRTLTAHAVDFSDECIADIMVQAPHLEINRGPDNNDDDYVECDDAECTETIGHMKSGPAIPPAFSQPGRFRT